MIFKNIFNSDVSSPENRRQNVIFTFYRCACVLGVLITVSCLFRCGLSLANALQDVHKFEHTHTYSYLMYYLFEYRFCENMCTLFLVVTELLFFIVQYRRAIHQKPLWSGFLYFLAALLNVFYLKYLPYSVVLPMTSITYLWTMFISAFLLKEKLNKWNFIGIGLIFVGIFILGTLKTV